MRLFVCPVMHSSLFTQTTEGAKMADNVPESGGSLKRKPEEGETRKTKDENLFSPPAKIRSRACYPIFE